MKPSLVFRRVLVPLSFYQSANGRDPDAVYGTTNAVYGTTNADVGVGIGSKGGFKNLIEKVIN